MREDAAKVNVAKWLQPKWEEVKPAEMCTESKLWASCSDPTGHKGNAAQDKVHLLSLNTASLPEFCSPASALFSHILSVLVLFIFQKGFSKRDFTDATI